MADNTTLPTSDAGGDTIASDDIGGVKYPRSKISLGADGTAVDAGAGAGAVGTDTQRVTLGSDDPAVTALELIDNAVSGAGFNITQFAGATVPVGAGVEATALRVTVATDSTGTLSVDDGGGALTVDGTVTANLSATDNAVLDTINTAVVATQAAVEGTLTVASHAVTNAGTFATQATCTNAGTFAVQIDAGAVTSLALIDDAIYADDAAFTLASSKVMAGGAIRDDALSTLTAVEGDVVPLRVGSTGALHVTGGGGGTQYSVDDAGPTVVTMAGVVRDDTLTTLTEVDGDASLLRVSSTGALHTIAAANAGVDIGSVGIKSAQTLALVTSVSTVVELRGSNVVHDDADSLNPHKIGAKAVTSISGQTLVADDDRTNLFAGVDGVLITRPHCNLEDVLSEVDTNTDGAATAFASGMAAPGAGIKIYLTKVTISNSSATFCTVDLRDGAAGAVLWTLPVPATGGVTHSFEPPIPLTANTALAYDASAATTTLTIAAAGFKSKV